MSLELATSSRMFHLIGLICIVLSSFVHRCDCFQCYSCYAGCPTLSQCECRNQTCDGAYCFSKIERYPANGVSAILKGCADDVPVDLLGCQYAGEHDSLECYCRGNLCNVAERMQNYKPKELPKVQCCECDPDERLEKTSSCKNDNCTRTCFGHYCFTDLANNARGCGYGYPVLYNSLRTSHLAPFLPEQTCVNSTSGNPRIQPWSRVCECASNYCNRKPSSWFGSHVGQSTSGHGSRASLTTAAPTILKLLNCHSLFNSSLIPFTVHAYGKASTCQGHYCFLSLNTHDIKLKTDYNNYDGLYNENEDGSEEDDDEDHDNHGEYRRNRRTEHDQADTVEGFDNNLKIVTPSYNRNYEFKVGCLLVDDKRKVRTGCTTEYGENGSQVISRVCVCDEEYCNFYNLLTGEPAATLVPKRRPLSTTTIASNSLTTKINSPEVVATLVLPYDRNRSSAGESASESVSERIKYNDPPTQNAVRIFSIFPIITLTAIYYFFCSAVF